jgi:hypothetical protein
VLKGPFPAGEAVIAKNAEFAPYYNDFIKTLNYHNEFLKSLKK